MNVPHTTSAGEMPERGNCYDAGCAANHVLGHVTSRWGTLILGALLDGTQRYSELRGRIGGISEKMLAQKLREFERDGLIERRQYPVVPPRVDYTLTPTGTEVALRLRSLILWLEDHVRDLLDAQTGYDGEHMTSDHTAR